MSNNKLIIFSAPSGAGKTTIVHQLLEIIPNIEFSISATSREKRVTEIHGEDYYFMSADRFKAAIENDEFVEWEEVYQNQFYGTLKTELKRIWDKGHHIIFDIDVQGGLNLKKEYGSNALAVFIQPPSVSALEERLRKRKTESEEKIKQRISKAQVELSCAQDFDVIIVNDDLQTAVQEAKTAIEQFLKA